MEDAAHLTEYLQAQFPAALEMLRRMVGINSFTLNVEGVNRLAAFTAQCFAPLGFEAARVASTNAAFADHLVLRRPGRGKANVAMISHLDTVFPPEEEARNHFCWQPEGDRVFGPGTQDIKGGTVMMWLVLSALRVHEPELFEETGWTLLLNSSEETYSPDFGEVCRRHFDQGTLAALVFEAEGGNGKDHLLVVSRKGRATWRATVSGRGSHAGSKHSQGANAIVQLGRTVQRIQALTDYTRGVTVNVGTISGGTVLNRVPHEAVAEGEMRAFTPEVYRQAREALLALSGKGDVCSPADGFACDLRVEILTETGPWPRNGGSDALFELWKTTARDAGLEIAYEQRGGLSDGNLVWDAVPTLDGLGPWGDNDHCSERSHDGSKLPEFVDTTTFVPKAVLNAMAISKLAKSSAALPE